MKFSNGTLPHDKMMTSIELYGTRVQPRVRELLDTAGYKPGAFTLLTQKRPRGRCALHRRGHRSERNGHILVVFEVEQGPTTSRIRPC